MHPEDKEYEAQREAEEVAARAALNETRKRLLPLLRQSGETKVTLDFNGEGDEGLLDNLVCETGMLDDQLSDQVADFLGDVLELHYAGYECEDGAFGTLTWYIEADRLVVDFNVRLQASRLFKSEIDVDGEVLIEQGEPVVEGD